MRKLAWTSSCGHLSYLVSVACSSAVGRAWARAVLFLNSFFVRRVCRIAGSFRVWHHWCSTAQWRSFCVYASGRRSAQLGRTGFCAGGRPCPAFLSNAHRRATGRGDPRGSDECSNAAAGHRTGQANSGGGWGRTNGGTLLALCGRVEEGRIREGLTDRKSPETRATGQGSAACEGFGLSEPGLQQSRNGA